MSKNEVDEQQAEPANMAELTLGEHHDCAASHAETIDWTARDTNSTLPSQSCTEPINQTACDIKQMMLTEMESELTNIEKPGEQTTSALAGSDTEPMERFALEVDPVLQEEEFSLEKDAPPLLNQLLILSSAGKPIYTLIGDEERVAGLCGVVQALLSVAAGGGDALRSVRAGRTRVLFLTRGPLILAAVCANDSPASLLSLQLTWALEQVVSVLTLTQLSAVLERRRNYDLRRLLGGAERLVGAAATRVRDPSAVLGGVRALALAPAAREAAGAALAAAAGPLPHAVFALLVAADGVVAAARRRKYELRPADLLVLLNLVHATASFRAAETWTPVCLPHFDPTGFLHAHVSYVSARACLLLLSVQRDAFFSLSEARRRIVEALRCGGTLDAIDAAAADPPLLTTPAGDLERFVYKCTESDCVASAPSVWLPARVHELARAVDVVRAAHAAKLLYTRTHTHTLLAWVTSGFEVYVWLAAWPDKASCIVSVDRLLRLLRRDQDRLLLPPAHTF